MSAGGTGLLMRTGKPSEPTTTWPSPAGHAAIVSPSLKGENAAAKLASSPNRRTHISDLHGSLHCSIIGTCLTTGDLRRLLLRLKVIGAEAADDHDLHVMGVLLAGKSKVGAKHLQKTLDRRHELALKQFAKAKDAAALAALWKDALGRGDIPGAYWALITHPAATDQMVKEVFGEVHMLSHLVGAANRADIRRLRQLEEETAALTAKLDRQQKQLRDGFTGRDQTIRRLNDLLARKVVDEVASPLFDSSESTAAFKAAFAELDKRLTHATSLGEHLAKRLEAASGALNEAQRALQSSESQRDALRQELASIEARIGMLLQDEDGDQQGALDLHGLTVLYVGGRANQAPQLKRLVERTRGRFLHHDGGIEHSAALLPGLVSRADVAVFPVDCVSHDAAASVKRVCRQLGKQYMPLRSSSLTCLLSGLAAMQDAETSPPVEALS
jgi:Uncharacterized protein conserved in bacteria (DUF2325)